MKKTKLIFIVAALLIFVFPLSLSAQEEKFADFKALLKDMIDVTNAFSEKMESAESSEEVAAAIESYAEAMEELEPRMEAMEEKYPDISPEDFPEELAEIMVEYGEMMERLQVAMQQIWNYMSDPAVQQALEKMN